MKTETSCKLNSSIQVPSQNHHKHVPDQSYTKQLLFHMPSLLVLVKLSHSRSDLLCHCQEGHCRFQSHCVPIIPQQDVKDHNMEAPTAYLAKHLASHSAQAQPNLTDQKHTRKFSRIPFFRVKKLKLHQIILKFPTPQSLQYLL